MKKSLMSLGALGAAALAIVAGGDRRDHGGRDARQHAGLVDRGHAAGRRRQLRRRQHRAAGGSALQLTTDATTTAKAQYLHDASTPLASVTELGYSTKQNSASFVGGDPSYQLLVNLGGDDRLHDVRLRALRERRRRARRVAELGRRRGPVLVEPHRHAPARARSSPAPAARPFYTLAGAEGALPDAVVVGFGVNIGTFNPSYNVETDLVDFNGTAYDFQPCHRPPTSKDECKNGGWQSFNQPDVQEPGRLRQLRRHRRQEQAQRLARPPFRLAREGPLRRALSFLRGPPRNRLNAGERRPGQPCPDRGARRSDALVERRRDRRGRRARPAHDRDRHHRRLRDDRRRPLRLPRAREAAGRCRSSATRRSRTSASLCSRIHAGQSPATVPDTREVPALWEHWLALKEGLGVDWDILAFCTRDVLLPDGTRYGTLCLHHLRAARVQRRRAGAARGARAHARARALARARRRASCSTRSRRSTSPSAGASTSPTSSSTSCARRCR